MIDAAVSILSKTARISAVISNITAKTAAHTGFSSLKKATTRQIVAFYVGKRDESAARQLEQRIPFPYTWCPMCTDHYPAYSGTLPKHLHWSKDKQSGVMAHVERWNNTLRQRLERFVRKTLSFSKSDQMHYLMLLRFIVDYNQKVASLTN